MLNIRKGSRNYSNSKDDLFNQRRISNIFTRNNFNFHNNNNNIDLNINNNNIGNNNYYDSQNNGYNNSIFINNYNHNYNNNNNNNNNDIYNDENINEEIFEENEGFEKISDEKKSDLQQIIVNLLGITKNGLWSEKCEASKALLFIFTEFHSDLKISSSFFLKNQLDLFNDESWKVSS